MGDAPALGSSKAPVSPFCPTRSPVALGGGPDHGASPDPGGSYHKGDPTGVWGAGQHPGTAWGLSLGSFTRLSGGHAGSSCEPPKPIAPSRGENRPPLSGGDGGTCPG